MTSVKSILCIPGLWKDVTELVDSIFSNNVGEFIFGGKVLLNLKTDIGFEVEIYDRDDDMKASFQVAGMASRLSDNYLDLIDKHTFVIYLIGEAGSVDKAKSIAEAGLAILKSGGVGIKVETAGKAFTKEQWAYHYQQSNWYEMFVLDSIVDEDGATYSCGMHNLGLRDTIVSGEDFQESVDLISLFGYYQLVDKPTITNNQTFARSADSPIRFQIVDEPKQPYDGHELFNNPFGMWRLKRK